MCCWLTYSKMWLIWAFCPHRLTEHLPRGCRGQDPGSPCCPLLSGSWARSLLWIQQTEQPEVGTGHWAAAPLCQPQQLPTGSVPSTCQSLVSLRHISCSLIWGQSLPNVPTPVQGPKAEVCVRHAYSALQIAHFTHGIPGSWVSTGDPRSLAQDTNATAGSPVLRLAPAHKHHLPVLFLYGVSGYPEVSPVPSTLHTSAWTSPWQTPAGANKHPKGCSEAPISPGPMASPQGATSSSQVGSPHNRGGDMGTFLNRILSRYANASSQESPHSGRKACGQDCSTAPLGLITDWMPLKCSLIVS